jgi:hypothetical protein
MLLVIVPALYCEQNLEEVVHYCPPIFFLKKLLIAIYFFIFLYKNMFFFNLFHPLTFYLLNISFYDLLLFAFHVTLLVT